MAITTMASRNEAESIAQMNSKGGTNLRRLGDSWKSYGGNIEEMFVFDYAVGKVLFQYERNGYDDSDFYAVIWNSEKKEPETVMFATTRGWSYPCNAQEDATPEVEAEYREWMKRVGAESIRVNDIKKAQTPDKGKMLRVIKGRKIAKGTVGYCFWIGQTNFGVSVGIQHEDGYREFTSLKNVEVAGWEAYLPEDWNDSVERRANAYASGSLYNGRGIMGAY